MKNTYSIIFTLIIGGASIYFFYQFDFIIAILLFVWFISRLFGYSLTTLFEGINHSENEKKSNIQMELWFNVAEILNNKIFDEVLEKINSKNKEFAKKNKKDFKILDRKEWTDKLVENYKKKYNNSEDFVADGVRYIWEKVKFNIKNNILWKDDKIFFGDFIIHDISIPYEYKGKDDDKYFFVDRIPAVVNIRIFVANGMIKLQVGDFDKRITPKFIKKEGLAVYQTHYTIASFPLMYAKDGIPLHYLNRCDYATDSHWNFWGSELGKKDKGKWIEESNKINKEITDYEYLNRFSADSVLDKKAINIMSDFRKKLSEWRTKDGKDFKSNEDDKGEDYVPDFLENDSVEYFSKFLRISLFDYNDYIQNKGKYLFSDYWEEHP